MKLLFNCSRTSFTNFDPVFYSTGEGANPTQKGECWWFYCSLQGALKHLQQRLRLGDGGYLQVCSIPTDLAKERAGSENTDANRGGEWLVDIEDSEKIMVFESIPVKELLFYSKGNQVDFELGDTKERLED